MKVILHKTLQNIFSLQKATGTDTFLLLSDICYLLQKEMLNN